MLARSMQTLMAGRFTTRSLVLYMIVSFGIAITFLVLATVMLHLESSFSFMVNDISNTGSLSRNPTGWPFFTIFMLVAGGITIPIASFFHRAMIDLGMPGHNLVPVFLMVGGAGTMLVGVSPSEIAGPFHLAFAVIAFGGHGVGLITFLPCAIKGGRAGVTWSYAILFTVIAGLFITQGHVIFNAGADFDAFRGGIFSVSLWEWLLFFSIIMVLVSVAINLARARDQHERSV